MDHVERLADYLAGELAADEQAALEAQLARDPALRRQLEALRRADTSLDALESPAPPEGFDARLDARLDRELSAILDGQDAAATRSTDSPATAATTASRSAFPTAGPADELAERRARRAPPRWLVATSGAAAALVVVAGVGIGIRGMLGPGADDMADESPATQTFGLEADEQTEDSADALLEAADGPLIVAGDRELDDPAADRLVEDDLALGLADRDLDGVAAAAARSSFLDVFTGDAPAAEADRLETPSDDADAGDSDAPAPDADDMDAADAAEEADGRALAIDPADPRLRTSGAVTDADLVDVARCLEVVLRDSPDAIPTYAELGTRDGDEVVAIGLVTRDPATDTFQRRELWVLDRATCDVRHIVQR